MFAGSSAAAASASVPGSAVGSAAASGAGAAPGGSATSSRSREAYWSSLAMTSGASMNGGFWPSIPARRSRVGAPSGSPSTTTISTGQPAPIFL